MSTDEVLFLCHMTMCGWLPPCHEGAAGCRPDCHLFSVILWKSSLAHLHASLLSQLFFEFRDQMCPEPCSFLMVLYSRLFSIQRCIEILYARLLSSSVLRLHACFSVSLVCVVDPDNAIRPVHSRCFPLEIHCRKVSNAERVNW